MSKISQCSVFSVKKGSFHSPQRNETTGFFYLILCKDNLFLDNTKISDNLIHNIGRRVIIQDVEIIIHSYEPLLMRKYSHTLVLPSQSSSINQKRTAISMIAFSASASTGKCSFAQQM